MQLDPSDHICAFYGKPAERDHIMLPFLRDRLAASSRRHLANGRA